MIFKFAYFFYKKIIDIIFKIIIQPVDMFKSLLKIKDKVIIVQFIRDIRRKLLKEKQRFDKLREFKRLFRKRI